MRLILEFLIPDVGNFLRGLSRLAQCREVKMLRGTKDNCGRCVIYMGMQLYHLRKLERYSYIEHFSIIEDTIQKKLLPEFEYKVNAKKETMCFVLVNAVCTS